MKSFATELAAAEIVLQRPDSDELDKTLARTVIQLVEERERPKELTEAQAKQILDAEKKLFTLDYLGTAEKRRTLNDLCLELFGWSPWA